MNEHSISVFLTGVSFSLACYVPNPQSVLSRKVSWFIPKVTWRSEHPCTALCVLYQGIEGRWPHWCLGWYVLSSGNFKSITLFPIVSLFLFFICYFLFLMVSIINYGTDTNINRLRFQSRGSESCINRDSCGLPSIYNLSGRRTKRHNWLIPIWNDCSLWHKGLPHGEH